MSTERKQRPPDDDLASNKYIPATENSQYVLYDGGGNKTYWLTASVSAPFVTLPPAKASLGKTFDFVRTDGAAAMVLYIETGKINGTSTYTVSAAFASFRSDGTNYWRIG